MVGSSDTGPRREALAHICQAFRMAILYVFGSRAEEALAWLEEEQNRRGPVNQG